MGFGDRQAHGIRDACSKRAGGDFNARGFKCFRVAWRFRAPLTELLDVVDGHRVVAGEVQEGVLQHAAMTGRQHKPIAVKPLGVFGVVL